MDTIPVEGAELSALTLGAATGTPLIMLHGLVAGNMASWYSAIALPLSASRRVLLYDQRGHGGSTTPEAGFDLPSQAKDLDAVLAHYGFGAVPVDVAGHSMGALVALHFALHYPGRVRSLTLVDAPMPASMHVAPSLRGIASAAALEAYIDIYPPAQGLRGRRRDRLRQRLSTLLFASTLLHDVSAMEAEPDDRLASLDLPVLLIYGTTSPCLAAGVHLRHMLPRAEWTAVDAGHYVPEEAPEAVLRHLADFLAARDAAQERAA